MKNVQQHFQNLVKKLSGQSAKERSLTKAYHHLCAFYANAHVPDSVNDTRGEWTISRAEQEALETVLGLLADCGADTQNPL